LYALEASQVEHAAEKKKEQLDGVGGTTGSALAAKEQLDGTALLGVAGAALLGVDGGGSALDGGVDGGVDGGGSALDGGVDGGGGGVDGGGECDARPRTSAA
jgi:hypothetical protein